MANVEAPQRGGVEGDHGRRDGQLLPLSASRLRSCAARIARSSAADRRLPKAVAIISALLACGATGSTALACTRGGERREPRRQT